MSEPVPGSAQPEPSVQQPLPEAAVSYAAPPASTSPVAGPPRRGTYVPKWVVAIAAVVVVGLGGFAVGKATANDTSDSRPAGFSPGSARQGQPSDGPGQQGGLGGRSGMPGGAAQGGGATQGGVGQHGPMTRSGGS